MSDASTTDAADPLPDSLPERDEIVAILTKHRGLFLHTVQGLTDEQARARPTVSELTLGGLVKHVASTIDTWLDFVERGADPGDDATDWESIDPAAYEAFANGFRLLPEETLAGAVADFRRVADRTDALARNADLDAVHALPRAPWFAPGEAWSNRRVFAHLLAELAQHAGHADIVREAIDGQKSMG